MSFWDLLGPFEPGRKSWREAGWDPGWPEPDLWPLLAIGLLVE